LLSAAFRVFSCLPSRSSQLKALSAEYTELENLGKARSAGYKAPIYAVSKVAVSVLTQILSKEQQNGLKINSACPGWCRTDRDFLWRLCLMVLLLLCLVVPSCAQMDRLTSSLGGMTIGAGMMAQDDAGSAPASVCIVCSSSSSTATGRRRGIGCRHVGSLQMEQRRTQL
jgi:hypothetical protein